MLSADSSETPNFQLLDLSYQPRDLLVADTSNPSIIYFFAPWCSVCRFSMDNLQSLYQRNPDVNIVAVALDFKDKQEVQQFVERMGLEFPILLGNQQVKQAYKVSAYPSYYVLDEQQQIQHKSMGYSTELGLYLRSL
ncbi:TlpA disulfide reductase family protein [Thalassotalea sp. Y01]|uniref:TlpA family protein disulfide reductase n=1 Tax=Thalassotalea sp. Y01 TaxID=2729613 RepID=UPI00145E74FA|nr:TlpA disulfide reductase family protein [Thalassotalea sp. Y01]NMP15298.1 TlpA family protein disulfide reductase [Thalassotalea sp. Y01]